MKVNEINSRLKVLKKRALEGNVSDLLNESNLIRQEIRQLVELKKAIIMSRRLERYKDKLIYSMFVGLKVGDNEYFSWDRVRRIISWGKRCDYTKEGMIAWKVVNLLKYQPTMKYTELRDGCREPNFSQTIAMMLVNGTIWKVSRGVYRLNV